MKFYIEKYTYALGEDFVKKYITSYINASQLKFEQFGDDLYYSIKNIGLDYVFNQNYHLRAIIFHSNDHEGYVGFKDSLPFSLEFTLSKDVIRDKLGAPNKENIGMKALNVPPADIYEFDNYRLILNYSDSFERILYLQVLLA